MPFDALCARLRESPPPHRPFVTLSYAQALDGSIAAERGHKSTLSGGETMAMTHAVRAKHDAILVGIGTVLADDPRLDVRAVSGPNPQVVVLDSALNTPMAAQVLQRGAWLACTTRAKHAAHDHLRGKGATPIVLPATQNGWVDLAALLDALHARGVRSLMVEGGGRVLSSFLASGLADHALITVAPRWLAGVPGVDRAVTGDVALPALQDWQARRIGSELVIGAGFDRITLSVGRVHPPADHQHS